MRRHKAFPRPGDRVRLAVPLPTDESEPHARYGTVLERSCGRTNALRVRWDREEVNADYGVDAGLETWLADAAWYWDKAHLEVVGGRRNDVPDAPAPTPARAPVSEEDAWLTASPRNNAGSPVEGSLDAMAEWEAALASEMGGAADGSWEQVLASALGNGSPVAPATVAPATVASVPVASVPVASVPVASAPRAPSSSQPQRHPAPAVPAAPVAQASVEAPDAHSVSAALTHRDIRRNARAQHEDADHPEPGPEPVAAPVKAWTGDDIIPNRPAGKRWGRR